MYGTFVANELASSIGRLTELSFHKLRAFFFERKLKAFWTPQKWFFFHQIMHKLLIWRFECGPFFVKAYIFFKATWIWTSTKMLDIWLSWHYSQNNQKILSCMQNWQGIARAQRIEENVKHCYSTYWSGLTPIGTSRK